MLPVVTAHLLIQISALGRKPFRLQKKLFFDQFFLSIVAARSILKESFTSELLRRTKYQLSLF